MLPSKPVLSGSVAPSSAAPSSAAHSDPDSEPETPCRVVSYRTRKLCLSHGRCCDAVYGAEPAPVMSRAEREALCGELPRLAALDPGHRGDHPLVFDLLSDTLADFAKEGRLTDLLALGLRRAAVLDLWRARGKPGSFGLFSSEPLLDELSRHGPPPLRDVAVSCIPKCCCVDPEPLEKKPGGEPRNASERALVEESFSLFRDVPRRTDELIEIPGSLSSDSEDWQAKERIEALTRDHRRQSRLINRVGHVFDLGSMADKLLGESPFPEELRLAVISAALSRGDSRLAASLQFGFKDPTARAFGLAMRLFGESERHLHPTPPELVLEALQSASEPCETGADRLVQVALIVALERHRQFDGELPEGWEALTTVEVPETQIRDAWLTFFRFAMLEEFESRLIERVSERLPLRFGLPAVQARAGLTPPAAFSSYLMMRAESRQVKRVFRHALQSHASSPDVNPIVSHIAALCLARCPCLSRFEDARKAGILTSEQMRAFALRLSSSELRELEDQTDELGVAARWVLAGRSKDPVAFAKSVLAGASSTSDRMERGLKGLRLVKDSDAYGVEHRLSNCVLTPSLLWSALTTPAKAPWLTRAASAAALITEAESGRPIAIERLLDADLIGTATLDEPEAHQSVLLALAQRGSLDISDRAALRRVAEKPGERPLSDMPVLVDALVLEGRLLDPDRYGEGVFDTARWDELVSVLNAVPPRSFFAKATPVFDALATWAPTALMMVDHHFLAIAPAKRCFLFEALAEHARRSGDRDVEREFCRLEELLEAHPSGDKLEPARSRSARELEFHRPKKRRDPQASIKLMDRSPTHFLPSCSDSTAAFETGRFDRGVELARAALSGPLETIVFEKGRRHSSALVLFQHPDLARQLLPELVRLAEREQARGERLNQTFLTALIDGLLVIPELEDGDFRRLLRMRPGNVGLRRIAAAVTRHHKLDRLAKVIERASDSEEMAAIVGAVKAALELAGRGPEAMAVRELLDVVLSEREDLLQPLHDGIAGGGRR